MGRGPETPLWKRHCVVAYVFDLQLPQAEICRRLDIRRSTLSGIIATVKGRTESRELSDIMAVAARNPRSGRPKRKPDGSDLSQAVREAVLENPAYAEQPDAGNRLLEELQIEGVTDQEGRSLGNHRVFNALRLSQLHRQGPGEQPRRKGPRASSCKLCRLRKIKCDRQEPCGSCTRLGNGNGASACWYTPEQVDRNAEVSNANAAPPLPHDPQMEETEETHVSDQRPAVLPYYTGGDPDPSWATQSGPAGVYGPGVYGLPHPNNTNGFLPYDTTALQQRLHHALDEGPDRDPTHQGLSHAMDGGPHREDSPDELQGHV